MLFRKKYSIKIFLTVLFLFIPLFAGAINLNQLITLKKDGSGTIKFIYTEKDATVKGKNFLMGNFPFAKDKLEEYFNSATTQVYLSEVNPDPKDNSLLVVRVEINFSDINKLGDMKGFTNLSMKLAKSDSGNVLTQIFTSAFLKATPMDMIYGSLEYDGKIKSTNGKLDGKKAIWFRNKDFIDVTQNIYFVANLESDGPTTSGSNDGNEKGKSCGLFGFEFPVIILLGSSLIFVKRKKRV